MSLLYYYYLLLLQIIFSVTQSVHKTEVFTEHVNIFTSRFVQNPKKIHFTVTEIFIWTRKRKSIWCVCLKNN